MNRHALTLSIVVAFVMPVLFFVVPFAVGVVLKARSDDLGFLVPVALLGLVGAALWIAAVVSSILAVSRARDDAATSRGWISAGLCGLALITGGVAWFFGLIFGMGGGPH